MIIEIKKTYPVPTWLIAIVVIIAIGIMVVGFSYPQHKNELLLNGAQLGYDRAIMDAVNIVAREGILVLNFNDVTGTPQSLYLVPAQQPTEPPTED